MKDEGKKNVLGVLVDAVDYEAAIEKIVAAAKDGRGYSVSALAVHGVVTGTQDPEQLYRLNNLDLITPDGQPVRWAMNALYRTNLSDRVYGPILMMKLCERAAREGIPVYFYGSHDSVLDRLKTNMKRRFPQLDIAGAEPSKFRSTTEDEQRQIAGRIKESGAKITFVGLGCPRQEVFAYEYRDILPMPVLAVGAAFDYHAGTLKEPPLWIQRAGLQWFYRLVQDPRRLWKRYLVFNTIFVLRFLAQMLGLWNPTGSHARSPKQPVLYG